MKKIFGLLLCFIMMICMVSCGDSNEASKEVKELLGTKTNEEVLADIISSQPESMDTYKGLSFDVDATIKSSMELEFFGEKISSSSSTKMNFEGATDFTHAYFEGNSTAKAKVDDLSSSTTTKYIIDSSDKTYYYSFESCDGEETEVKKYSEESFDDLLGKFGDYQDSYEEIYNGDTLVEINKYKDKMADYFSYDIYGKKNNICLELSMDNDQFSNFMDKIAEMEDEIIEDDDMGLLKSMASDDFLGGFDSFLSNIKGTASIVLLLNTSYQVVGLEVNADIDSSIVDYEIAFDLDITYGEVEVKSITDKENYVLGNLEDEFDLF